MHINLSRELFVLSHSLCKRSLTRDGLFYDPAQAEAFEALINPTDVLAPSGTDRLESASSSAAGLERPGATPEGSLGDVKLSAKARGYAAAMVETGVFATGALGVVANFADYIAPIAFSN